MKMLLMSLFLFVGVAHANDPELTKWKQKFPSEFDELSASYPELADKSSSFRVRFAAKLAIAEARNDPNLKNANFLSQLASSIPREPYLLTESRMLFEKKKSPPLKKAGNGILTVSNTMGVHAIIKLISADEKYYSFYIKPSDSYTVRNIPENNYRVIYAFSKDGKMRGQDNFSTTESAAQFQDGILFSESTTPESGKIVNRYTNIKLTLYAVVNGNAKTDPLDITVFEKY